MAETRVDKSKRDEKNFKKALLNRYLEDQVLYNRHTPQNKRTSVSDDDVFDDEKCLSARQTNDVIVKINDELTSPESQNQLVNQCEALEKKKLPSDLSQANNNRLTAVHSKLSKSLDEDQFKSLYLDIPNKSDSPIVDMRSNKRRDLKRPQLHVRKYSDCSNNRTKSYQHSSSGRHSATYCYDVHNHPTNTLARGILKKISLPGPGFGGSDRVLGRKQIISLSSFEGSIQDLNRYKDGEKHRASMSSFKSSCSSFPEVEFGDSDYDRSCTSSPCSPLHGTCRFPPINTEMNNQ